MKKFLRKFMLLKSDEQLVWAIIMGMILSIATFIPMGLTISSFINNSFSEERLSVLKLAWKSMVCFWLAWVLVYILLGILGKYFGRTEKINW